MDRSNVAYAPLRPEEEQEAIPAETQFKPTMEDELTEVPVKRTAPEFGPPADEVFLERVQAAEAAHEWALEWAGMTRKEPAKLAQGISTAVEHVVGAWKEFGYEWTSTRGVREELTETKRQVQDLEGELLFHEQAARFAAASAASSELGLFMMHKIGQQEEGLPVGEVAANLEGPEGWLAIARLMKAGLIDENGLSFYLTPEGEQALSERSTS